IKMPQLGESVHEGTIGKWLKRPGESVAKYEPLVEVITDKVNVEMPSPFAGVLKQILVKEGETVVVGTAIAVIEEAAGAPAAARPSAAAVPHAAGAPASAARPASDAAARAAPGRRRSTPEAHAHPPHDRRAPGAEQAGDPPRLRDHRGGSHGPGPAPGGPQGGVAGPRGHQHLAHRLHRARGDPGAQGVPD